MYKADTALCSGGGETQPTKGAGTLRRAVRSQAFARILGGRHMECAYYVDFCRLCRVHTYLVPFRCVDSMERSFFVEVIATARLARSSRCVMVRKTAKRFNITARGRAAHPGNLHRDTFEPQRGSTTPCACLQMRLCKPVGQRQERF